MKHDHSKTPQATAVHGFSPGFAALGLEAGLLAALETLGYEEPTPIQREAVPPLLSGRDVLGQAAKTATWPRVSIKQFYWQLYIMLSPPLIAVPGVQPMPLRAA